MGSGRRRTAVPVRDARAPGEAEIRSCAELEAEILAPKQTGGKAIVARLDAEIDLRLAFHLRCSPEKLRSEKSSL